jgi:hypothetical protein
MKRALALCLTADRVSAEEGQAMGLIYKVFDDASFAGEVAAFVKPFATGPALARLHRLTGAVLIALHGYFDSGQREVIVGVGLLLLIWLPALRCPARVAAVAGIIAEGSLYSYLTHFQVYPLFGHPLPGVVVSLLVGSFLAWAVNAVRRHLSGLEITRPGAAGAPRLTRFRHPAA